MNNKLSALLASAIVTGLLTAQVAKAEDAGAQKTGDQLATEKNGCKGTKAGDKNSCKGMKKKASDKNSCKNGCGEAKDKKADTKEESK